MAKIAYIYGGQGMQKQAMGYDFYQKFDEIRDFYDDISIRFDLKDYSFNKNEETISNTRYTQAIIIAYELAVTKLIKKLIKADYLIGLSIGEYACLNTAGVLSDRDVLKIADYRGEFMKNSSKNLDTVMLAIIKTEKSIIEDVIRNLDTEHPVEIANINSKQQIVVGGEKSALDQFSKKLKERGVRRIVPLNVSSAFHTSYMKDAADELEKFFEDIEFKPASLPIAWNRLGRVDNNVNIKKLMVEQIQKPVLLYPAILDLIGKGVDTFIEIGTNKTMKNLLKRIDPSLKVYSIGSVEDYEDFKNSMTVGI